ncbi:MAG: hypothetical protein ACXAEX_21225 [Promethearchaeota archaeon]
MVAEPRILDSRNVSHAHAQMNFHADVIYIVGHNGADVTRNGEYYIFFGGYEESMYFNGVIVTEEEIEMAINHEILHCVIDWLGEDAEALDRIWYKYDVPFIPLLVGCTEMGLGFPQSDSVYDVCEDPIIMP